MPSLLSSLKSPIVYYILLCVRLFLFTHKIKDISLKVAGKKERENHSMKLYLITMKRRYSHFQSLHRAKMARRKKNKLCDDFSISQQLIVKWDKKEKSHRRLEWEGEKLITEILATFFTNSSSYGISRISCVGLIIPVQTYTLYIIYLYSLHELNSLKFMIKSSYYFWCVMCLFKKLSTINGGKRRNSTFKHFSHC